ncbi:putative sulfate exporter family transporter [Candidatus Kapaibacterium sp.]
MNNQILIKIIFFMGAIATLTPFINPPLALLMGLIFSQVIVHPYKKYNSKITKILLQVSVVGLGFGINLFEAAKAGEEGLILTISTIFLTLLIGTFLGKILRIKKNTTALISTGTAICGGSAIAAVSPVLDAKEDEMSVALATIFILNSLALFIFPYIGEVLNLSQEQFGLWSAIAIHDTSSVVGAASKYGEEALKIATTVKLERALWIIPVTILYTFIYKKKGVKISIPYFIFFFVVAMIINTYIPETTDYGRYIVIIAKKGLTLTLFFIGLGLSRDAVKSVGVKPLVLGVLLWIIISVSSLLFIYQI